MIYGELLFAGFRVYIAKPSMVAKTGSLNLIKRNRHAKIMYI